MTNSYYIDLLALTDHLREGNDIVERDFWVWKWLQEKDTLEFLILCEQDHNYLFNITEANNFCKKAGPNNFSLYPDEWIEATKATSLQLCNDSVYASLPVALHYLTWLDPSFSYIAMKLLAEKVTDCVNDLGAIDKLLSKAFDGKAEVKMLNFI